ncbi:putative dihydroneopterin aldolase [Diplogelasinospora grovesii]|uniref:dihydroneopterin aldolase n=1 Tax=Diplogelasinospora grovesii TaxID=303347 RepID=A0AAN6N993_9PEZI|nr:putative dihydroneopterin aldolase [Diplogelasinospora grovesii]
MDVDDECPLSTSWAVRVAAGEPFAVVRVKNLQAVIQGPKDAWGRKNKAQPVLVSAELAFHKPFDTKSDLLIGTVHYGNLSKVILASLERFGPGRAAASSTSTAATLRQVLERIWHDLVGNNIDGLDNDIPVGEDGPFLSFVPLRFMSVTIRLPKASLLGEGVSLTASSYFASELETTRGAAASQAYSLSLGLHNLRVPTLIGVNSNERMAKQFVVVNFDFEKFDMHEDLYDTLEKIIVDALETSSFETLEKLGAYLAERLLHHEHIKTRPGWQVRISMEKPTAVPFADCPVVEIRAGQD